MKVSKEEIEDRLKKIKILSQEMRFLLYINFQKCSRIKKHFKKFESPDVCGRIDKFCQSCVECDNCKILSEHYEIKKYIMEKLGEYLFDFI